MEFSIFTQYLIIVNIVGAVIYLINMLLYRFTASLEIDKLVTLAAILGATPGIVLCILLFDRKSVKENMMSRVFVFPVLIIQIIVYLVVSGHVAKDLTFAFWEFFEQHKLLLGYLGIINVITFICFAIDKLAAIRHKYRIRILVLLGLAFAGGSIGGLLGMYLLRHKTRKDYFTVGIPLILVMQIVVVFYAMNAAW